MKTLYRSECNEPKVVVFAGNGCIKNGWQEVKDVIQDEYRHFLPSINFPELLLLEAAESFRSRCQTSILGGIDVLEAFTKKQISDRSFYKIKESIGKKYRAITSERLVKIPYILEKLLFNTETCVITSNWDNALWNLRDCSIKNIAYIHGRADSPSSLIFPTELVKDSKIHMTATENVIKNLINT